MDISLEVDKDISDTKKNEKKYQSKDKIFKKDPTPEEIELAKQEAEKRLNALVQFKNEVKDHWKSCQVDPFVNKESAKPCKILVTYDSFRKVKEALQEIGVYDRFHIVIDEFQSVMTDSRFKPSTEMEFVGHLQDNPKVCYVSATPMLEKYLDQLDDFKDLPYIELDWEKEDKERVIHPIIESYPCAKMLRKAEEIITKFRSEDGFRPEECYRYKEPYTEKIIIIPPKHAVLYFNSVVSICSLINRLKLTPDECNILCADTSENEKKIRSAFKIKPSDPNKYIGSVPLPDEEWKLFTFCTRTVYLGADFYSDNAKSYIFSDANVECLAIDISIDLPQILGRMRNDKNPWKYIATIYFNPIRKNKKELQEEFDSKIKEKTESTNTYLSIWNKISSKEQLGSAKLYELNIKVNNYRDDYLALNRHAGGVPVAVFNNLVLVAEQRAFDIQQVDYADRCTVFNAIDNRFDSIEVKRVNGIIDCFNMLDNFYNKMKYLCDSNIKPLEAKILFSRIPPIYGNYFDILGAPKIRSLGYSKVKLDKEIDNLFIKNNLTVLDKEVYAFYKEGDKFSKADLKLKLQDIYNKCKYIKKAKASDISGWFDIKDIFVYDINNKRSHGFELLKRLKN
jgi:hypothetical protein